MEFNIDSLKFPDSPDQIINQGDILEIIVDVFSVGLQKNQLYDINKIPSKLTILDSKDNMYSVHSRLVETSEDIRSLTRSYKFYTKVGTENLEKGDIRIIGSTYDIQGQLIPIRQKHKIV